MSELAGIGIGLMFVGAVFGSILTAAIGFGLIIAVIVMTGGNNAKSRNVRD